MGIYTEFLGTLLFLSLFASAALAIALILYRKRIREKDFFLKKWESFGGYTEYTGSFFEEAVSVIGQIRRAIRVFHTNSDRTRLSQEETAFLTDCDALLNNTFTGNETVDALLFTKKKRCSELGIHFTLEIQAIPDGELSELLITSLLGNLLDNAIEAAAASGHKAPRISVRSYIRKSVWIVKTENTKDIQARPLEVQMKTSKKEKKDHGIGLPILRQITNQYDGSLTFRDLEGSFEVQAMLVLPA